jgi:tRNA threonylcarbamoyladenosine biosynthesis protein TsaB
VSNLEAAAARAFDTVGAPSRLLVCQDARMHEVYWAAYERVAAGLAMASPEAVARPEVVALPAAWDDGGVVWGVGTGFDAYPLLAARLCPRLGRWLSLESRAEDIAQVAACAGLRQAVCAEQVAPVYLRNDVAASR